MWPKVCAPFQAAVGGPKGSIVRGCEHVIRPRARDALWYNAHPTRHEVACLWGLPRLPRYPRAGAPVELALADR